jgi:hypothetical protein
MWFSIASIILRCKQVIQARVKMNVSVEDEVSKIQSSKENASIFKQIYEDINKGEINGD